MTAKQRVLFVDDFLDNRILYGRYLERRCECDVKTADSVREAIQTLLFDDRFDVVLCDFQMDDGTGIDVYEFIRESNYDVKFIIFSACDPAVIRNDSRSGNFDILPKDKLFELCNRIR